MAVPVVIASRTGWPWHPPSILPFLDNRAIAAFSATKPNGLVSIGSQFVHFREKSMFFDRRFVMLSFVFIHIPGGSFIFDIFLPPSFRLRTSAR
jgi:hypothetical protein